MRLRTLARLRARSERGAAAVEFALVVIPLLYLISGVLVLGWTLSFRQAMSQAAAEGARAAAVSPSGFTVDEQKTAARNAVNDALSTYGISCASAGGLVRGSTNVGTCNIAVATCSNDPTSSCVSVALSYNNRDHPLIPFPGIGFVTPDSLSYTAVAKVS